MGSRRGTGRCVGVAVEGVVHLEQFAQLAFPVGKAGIPLVGRPLSQGTPDEGYARFPHWEGELRKLFEVDHAFDGNANASSSSAAAAHSDLVPERSASCFGRYE